jgi:hypothetical protein
MPTGELRGELLKTQGGEAWPVPPGAGLVRGAVGLARGQVVGDVVAAGHPGVLGHMRALRLQPVAQVGANGVGSRRNVASVVELAQHLAERPSRLGAGLESALPSPLALAVWPEFPEADPPGPAELLDGASLPFGPCHFSSPHGQQMGRPGSRRGRRSAVGARRRSEAGGRECRHARKRLRPFSLDNVTLTLRLIEASRRCRHAPQNLRNSQNRPGAEVL